MEAATAAAATTIPAAVTVTPKNHPSIMRIEQKSSAASAAVVSSAAPPPTTTLTRRLEQPNQPQHCSITITNTANNLARTIISGSGSTNLNGVDRNKLPPLSVVPIPMISTTTSIHKGPNGPNGTGTKVLTSGSYTAAFSKLGTNNQQKQPQVTAPLTITATGSVVRRSAGTSNSITPRTTLTPISKINQQLMSALPSNVANSITITAKSMPGAQQRSILNGSALLSNAVAAAKAAASQPSGSNSGGAVTTNIIPPGTTITKIANSGGGGLLSNSRIIQIKTTPAAALTRTSSSMHVATKPFVRTSSAQTLADTQIPTPPPQQQKPPVAISILDAKVSASAAKTLPSQFQHLHQYMSNNQSAGGTSAGPPTLLKTTNSGDSKTIFITKGRNSLPPVDVTLTVAQTTNVATTVAVATPRPITTIISHPKPAAAVATPVQSSAASSNNNNIVEPKRISVQIMNGVLSDPMGPIQLLQSSEKKAAKLPVPEPMPQSPRKVSATNAGKATSAPTSPKSESESDAIRLGSPTTGANRRRLVAAQPQSPRTQSRSQSLMVPPIATAPKFKRTRQRLPRSSEPTRLHLLIKAQLASDMADAAATSANCAPASTTSTASPSLSPAATPTTQPDTSTGQIPSPPFESLECNEQMDDRSSTASGSAFVSPERAEQQQMRAQTGNNCPAKTSKRPTDAEMAAVMTAVARDAAATTANERATAKTDVLSTVRWCKGSGYLPRSAFCLQTNEFMLVEPIKRVRSQVNSSFERLVNDEASFKLFRIHSTMRARPYPVRSTKQQLRFDQRLRLAEFAEQMGVRNQQLDAPGSVKPPAVSVLANTTTPSPSPVSSVHNTSSGRKEIPFNWESYLHVSKSIAAPAELFTNAFPSTSNGFEVGMKLEAVDPLNNSRFCVCTVLQVIGYRLRLAFDGYSHEYAFWVNADSTEIYPPGWCNKTGRPLMAPPGAALPFDWHTYLQVQQAKPAPRTLFTHLVPTTSAMENPFRVGMKLEADDLRDTNKLCVATVGDVVNNRVLIKLDGYDEQYDYWTDYRSPYLHPVNWHQVNGFGVTAPPDFKIPFNWDTYLMATKAMITKPEHVHTRKAHAFQVGMKLEVVDRRNPQLIRPATVIDLIDFDVKVLYDGWPEGYAYWMSDDHPDMHPVNWCARTGHPLEAPPSSQYHNQPGGCSSFGCRSIGHANDPDAATHVANIDCPYFMKNWKRDEKTRPNRLHQARVAERHRVDRQRYAGPQPRSKRYLDRIKLERLSRSSDESMRPTATPLAELRLMATVTPNGIIPNNTVYGEPVANAIRPPGIGGGAHAIADQSVQSASAPAALKSERANSSDSNASHNAASGTHNAPPAGEQVPVVAAGGNHRWVGPIQKDPLQFHRLEATQHILHDYLPTLAGTYNVWRRNACALFRRSANDGDATAAGTGIAPGQAHGNPMVWTPEDVADQVGKLAGCAHLSERFVEHEIDGNALLTMSQADLCGSPLRLHKGQAVKVSAWMALLREDAHTRWFW